MKDNAEELARLIVSPEGRGLQKGKVNDLDPGKWQTSYRRPWRAGVFGRVHRVVSFQPCARRDD
jgi:hypothetical protein